ncbi:MAG: Rieske 2Fe-2S domain-containing protein [Dehalococcoidia bacterium]|nr:Rieske 2Fe-2S domain-containing protein [Dehalococcoidia bacterium]
MTLSNLIVDDLDAGVFRVHRTAMTSQEILDLEWKQIFEKCWLYIGHESELHGPGDYRRRTIAGRPLILIRNNQGEIKAFYNTCTHRGALICRADEGKAKVFQCFYHAWTFDNNGALIGVPDEAGYGTGFDKHEMGLKPVERFSSYRGFCFVSFNPEVEDLVSYLGPATEYLDLIVDQSEAGMRVVAGSNKYAIKANWKLLAENSVDSYHAVPTHETYFQYLADVGGVLGPRGSDSNGRARSLGNGHAVDEAPAPYGRPIALWHPMFGEEAKAEIEQTRARLVSLYGEERAKRMSETIRLFLIFPNLVVHDIVSITIRQFWPVSPGEMEVTAWELAPGEEAGKVLGLRLDNFLTFLGPGGLATPDDVEALESCQIGYQADAVEWSDVSRGMHREPQATDEVQTRAFWRKWLAMMEGHSDYRDPEVVRADQPPAPATR